MRMGTIFRRTDKPEDICIYKFIYFRASYANLLNLTSNQRIEVKNTEFEKWDIKEFDKGTVVTCGNQTGIIVKPYAFGRNCLEVLVDGNTSGSTDIWDWGKTKLYQGKVRDAAYTSVWDGHITVTSRCKVNTDAKEVFDIETVDIDGINVLTKEYVTVGGMQYPVTELDEYDGDGYYRK